MMELLREIIGSLRLLYILFIVVIGMGGAWLSVAHEVHEDAGRAAADASIQALRSDPEAREWIDAVEEHDRRNEPRGSVAREWERDRREAEREEAIRAAYGY